MIPTIVAELALTAGQKAAASFATRFATSMGAVIGSQVACNAMNSGEKPLCLYDDPEEREKKRKVRTFRTVMAIACCSTAAAAINSIANQKIIDPADFI